MYYNKCCKRRVNIGEKSMPASTLVTEKARSNESNGN